jgi:hypothetical protein
VVWIAGTVSLVVLVFEIIALVDLVKYRHAMKTWELIAWAAFIIVIPLIGLFSYLLWRIARSDALTESIDFQREYSKGNKELPPRL